MSGNTHPLPSTSTESLALIEALGVEPKSVDRWALDSSTVTMLHLSDRLHLVASCGPGHPASVEFYAAHAPTTCAHPDSVIFWDVSGLTTTNIAVVRTCLGVGVEHSQNLRQVHMLYSSPMIGMVATVTNVALKGLIRFYPEADRFHAALRVAVEREGLIPAGS